jgi:hypothetical protein
MQNAKCKMQNIRNQDLRFRLNFFILHFALCILHFRRFAFSTFCIFDVQREKRIDIQTASRTMFGFKLEIDYENNIFKLDFNSPFRQRRHGAGAANSDAKGAHQPAKIARPQ